MSEFLKTALFREAKQAIGCAEANTKSDFGVWEPEDSHCFSAQSDLTDFYATLQSSPDIMMVDPKKAFYTPTYVTLGLGTLDPNVKYFDLTVRSRFHFDARSKEIMDPKFCVKDAGKEITRREFQSGRKTLRVRPNIEKLAQEHPDLPRSIHTIHPESWRVDSTQIISRSGFFFGHTLPDMNAVVWHAGSLDVCKHSIPCIYDSPFRNKVVVSGHRNEGEYEVIGVDILDPTHMSENGMRGVVETSLSRIKALIEQSGLPCLPNEMNKVEDAQLSAISYYEGKYQSRDGRTAALNQNIKPKDYRRAFMRSALAELSKGLPTPGSFYPEQTFPENGFIAPRVTL